MLHNHCSKKINLWVSWISLNPGNLCSFLQVIYDRESGRSRGFGFVTMSTVEDANAAIQKFDGSVSNLILTFDMFPFFW